MLALALLVAVGAACSDDPGPAPEVPVASESPTAQAEAKVARTKDAESAKPKPINKWVTIRPDWIGTRVLPKRPDGFGQIRPTPPLLRNRRFPTIDLFERPKSREFRYSIGPVPRDVLKRSTWRPKCPTTLDELRYLKMTFWGFDHLRHTGELIVNASVAEDVVGVFRNMYEAKFPIEEMRVTTLEEQRAKPTGDTNNTSSLECRKVTLGESWSQHAYGLAIDINPFHNPYLRGDLVAPELASAYTDRSWVRPGMIYDGDVVVESFAAIGWEWGGNWNSLKDWMHFSLNGN
jgi:D-alanyl-D-alanine carboxypeptidase